MSNVPQIRTVYAALRQLLGDKISSADALDFASHLIRFCLAKRAEARGYFVRDPYGEVPFEGQPVDIAMRDGGWMVMEYEADQFGDQTIGRISIFEIDANSAERGYIEQADATAFDSERLVRALGWLSTSKRASQDWGDDDSDEDLASEAEEYDSND